MYVKPVLWTSKSDNGAVEPSSSTDEHSNEPASPQQKSNTSSVTVPPAEPKVEVLLYGFEKLLENGINTPVDYRIDFGTVELLQPPNVLKLQAQYHAQTARVEQLERDALGLTDDLDGVHRLGEQYTVYERVTHYCWQTQPANNDRLQLYLLHTYTRDLLNVYNAINAWIILEIRIHKTIDKQDDAADGNRAVCRIREELECRVKDIDFAEINASVACKTYNEPVSGETTWEVLYKMREAVHALKGLFGTQQRYVLTLRRLWLARAAALDFLAEKAVLAEA